MKINPHINFNGNAFEAFTFYKSVFGGEFDRVMRLADLASDDFPIDTADAQNILYISLPIGTNKLIGNDVPSAMGPVNERENRSKISLSSSSREEATKIYDGLSQGGEIEMPLADSPWGTYFAMFRDRYGIEWMIEFDPNNPS